MRGQKLFVRPIESDDSEAVRRFLEQESGGQTILPVRTSGSAGPASSGLLGKLVGELVAVAEIRLTADAIQIDNVVVARELRRKRIGRVMLDEIERLAEKMDRNRLIVGEPGAADEFFRRTGFEREGARWIRYVRSQGAQRASR
jgi:N-acetylglutamate synthase-like GNAT family acetyltransferase